MKYQFKAHKIVYIMNILLLTIYLIHSFVIAMFVKSYPFVLAYANNNEFDSISQQKVAIIYQYRSMI